MSASCVKCRACAAAGAKFDSGVCSGSASSCFCCCCSCAPLPRWCPVDPVMFFMFFCCSSCFFVPFFSCFSFIFNVSQWFHCYALSCGSFGFGLHSPNILISHLAGLSGMYSSIFRMKVSLTRSHQRSHGKPQCGR